MALRFSYRINADAPTNGSAQPERQGIDSHHGSQPTDANQPHHDKEQSMQERPPSCIDLLTSF